MVGCTPWSNSNVTTPSRIFGAVGSPAADVVSRKVLELSLSAGVGPVSAVPEPGMQGVEIESLDHGQRSNNTAEKCNCHDATPKSTMQLAICNPLAQLMVDGISRVDTANADIVAKNPDWTVTVTASEVAYNNIFHPKTRANWHIAQAANDALRKN
ncbi:hypothetical protein B0H63DRAFT_518361 [Podospora didyma]|uniref:Uncharacterized protein n=1 Tax=Podospora didyma TaxID=330526 RepID=A0AAE0P8L8_9PEZI|nr:hypothetical protein B0H63DRAFT_518361 [Podospora didyma]